MELLNTNPNFAGRFGDKRIDAKAAQLLNRLIIGRNSSIRHITVSEAEQRSFYRLLDNASFSESALEQSIMERCGELCGGRHLLCIQDTVEFNLNNQRNRIQKNSGLGKTTKAEVLGFMLHSSLAIDADGAMPLGYTYIKAWNRDQEQPDRHQRQYKRQPIANKESNKWIAASEQTKRMLSASKAITIIADRESDIYDLLASIPDEKTHLLLRSNANRRLKDGGTLKDHLKALPIMHTFSIDITGDHRKGRKKRRAEITVKWSKVSIQKPDSCLNPALPENIELYVVEAQELNHANGIYWRLLTTHEVTNTDQAMQVIAWYRERWNIEQMHRLLKNQGIRIEQSQLEKGYAIRKLTLMAMMAALRILQMMLAYEEEQEHPAAIAFSEEQQDCLSQANLKTEGETEKQKNPHRPKTLKWATWIIARLGGWKGYTAQRKPGPIVLQKGLVKFYQMFEGWLMAQQFQKDVYTQ
jgi:hypothetical protein